MSEIKISFLSFRFKVKGLMDSTIFRSFLLGVFVIVGFPLIGVFNIEFAIFFLFCRQKLFKFLVKNNKKTKKKCKDLSI
jgi:hypothetical protein